MDLAQLVTTGISVLALVVAFWTAWDAHIRPASLKIDFNFLVVGKDRDDKVVLVVPVSIMNDGAKPATVDGTCLIELATKSCLFSTWVTIKNESLEAFFLEKRMDGVPSPSIESTQTPFVVPPRDQVSKTIVFMPEGDVPAIDNGVRAAYQVVMRANGKNWTATRTIVWPDKAKELVSKGRALFQSTEEFVAWREGLRRSMRTLRLSSQTRADGRKRSVGRY